MIKTEMSVFPRAESFSCSDHRLQIRRLHECQSSPRIEFFLRGVVSKQSIYQSLFCSAQRRQYASNLETLFVRGIRSKICKMGIAPSIILTPLDFLLQQPPYISLDQKSENLIMFFSSQTFSI